jgi:hypothetical protein
MNSVGIPVLQVEGAPLAPQILPQRLFNNPTLAAMSVPNRLHQSKLKLRREHNVQAKTAGVTTDSSSFH